MEKSTKKKVATTGAVLATAALVICLLLSVRGTMVLDSLEIDNARWSSNLRYTINAVHPAPVDGNCSAFGQSFKGTDNKLIAVEFLLGCRENNPGKLVARLYSAVGNYDNVNGISNLAPYYTTGSLIIGDVTPLASSEEVDSSIVPISAGYDIWGVPIGGYRFVRFQFAQPYQLSSGECYCIDIEATGESWDGSITAFAEWGPWLNKGNLFCYGKVGDIFGWWGNYPYNNYDAIFRLYGETSKIPYDWILLVVLIVVASIAAIWYRRK